MRSKETLATLKQKQKRSLGFHGKPNQLSSAFSSISLTTTTRLSPGPCQSLVMAQIFFMPLLLSPEGSWYPDTAYVLTALESLILAFIAFQLAAVALLKGPTSSSMLIYPKPDSLYFP